MLDVLERTFFLNYCPGQELSVDEAMIKYKGHARGKVRMPKKLVKIDFTVVLLLLLLWLLVHLSGL